MRTDSPAFRVNHEFEYWIFSSTRSGRSNTARADSNAGDGSPTNCPASGAGTDSSDCACALNALTKLAARLRINAPARTLSLQAVLIIRQSFVTSWFVRLAF